MKNKVIAIVLAAALTTGIGAGFIYTQHVNKNMVQNNVVATEQNAANDLTESKVETVKESKKAAPVETKKADKASAKKAVETKKAAAKADDKKQNTQKAEATKKAEVKTSAKSEKTADHVQKVAATKKAEVKAADAKKAEVKAADTKKADKDMSEAEWNKIVDQRMRERYEESLRHADDVQNIAAETSVEEGLSEEEWNKAYDEAVKHYEEDLKKADKNDNEEWSKIVEERLDKRCEESARHANDVVDEDHMTEEEWNKLVEERGRQRYEASLSHADDVQDTDEDKYINNETPDPGQVVSEETLHANDYEDNLTEEEWNKVAEERFAQRCEESLRHANDRPDTESTTETDVEIQSDAE